MGLILTENVLQGPSEECKIETPNGVVMGRFQKHEETGDVTIEPEEHIEPDMLVKIILDDGNHSTYEGYFDEQGDFYK